MSYTGHKQITMADGQSLVDWLKPSLTNEARYFGQELPTDMQIAIVISVLRDHSLLMHAAEYDFSELGNPDEVARLWPLQSSVGRFFRDAASDVLERGQRS